MRIVFMGTPDFAGNVLQALVDAGHEITGVYTQPDKPKGRSGKLVPSYVGEMAERLGLPVYKPVRIKVPEEVERLKGIPADIFVVAAYGQFLSEAILDIPRLGCVNVHGSLLPKYRGASPIQRAIMNGDTLTGVTLIRMDKGMDSGDIYTYAQLPIGPEDDEASMYDKLSKLGGRLLADSLPAIEDGTMKPVKQDESLVTFAPMLKKEEGLIDLNSSAAAIDCLVRGISVWPVAYTVFRGTVLKIGRACPVEVPGELAAQKPGTLLFTGKKLYLRVGVGALELISVQPESKKMMSGADFARGARLQGGERLG